MSARAQTFTRLKQSLLESLKDEADQLRHLFSWLDRARTYAAYAEYVHYRAVLAALAGIASTAADGYQTGVTSEEQRQANNPDHQVFWNPIEVIGQATLPVLTIFDERDTQVDPIQGVHAFREALERAGNPNFRLEIISGADHAITLVETGCTDERSQRVQSGDWTIAIQTESAEKLPPEAAVVAKVILRIPNPGTRKTVAGAILILVRKYFEGLSSAWSADERF